MLSVQEVALIEFANLFSIFFLQMINSFLT